LLSVFSKTNRRAAQLTSVEFSVKSCCLCHLTGHICKSQVTRLNESSRSTINSVSEFTFGLLNKPGKLKLPKCNHFWLLQSVRDVELHCLSCIVSEGETLHSPRGVPDFACLLSCISPGGLHRGLC
jgi:hypothetical protein